MEKLHDSSEQQSGFSEIPQEGAKLKHIREVQEFLQDGAQRAQGDLRSQRSQRSTILILVRRVCEHIIQCTSQEQWEEALASADKLYMILRACDEYFPY